MFIVFISARYKQLLAWMNDHGCVDIKAIEFVKKVGPRIFLYIDTELSYQEVVRVFKKAINAHGGIAYVYSIYCLYQGMIDYYDYMSKESKEAMSYYQSKNKDLSEDEQRIFIKDR